MIVPNSTLHLCHYTMIVNGNDGEAQLTICHTLRQDGTAHLTIVASEVDGECRVFCPPVVLYTGEPEKSPLLQRIEYYLHLWTYDGTKPTREEDERLRAIVRNLMTRITRHVFNF
jgi:hypothetical protein